MDLAPATPSGAVEWRIAEGLTPYPEAVAAMEARVAAIRAGIAPECVWLVEHPPLYTAGTSARDEDLFNPAGLPTYRAGRGGQWTYHGPGQRVGYVMLDLRKRGADVRAHVHGLETWLVAALDRLGVRAETRADRIGLWVPDRRAGTEAKIAAIGVRVTRWVTWHGFALNVEPELAHFDGIVPCGVRGHGVTSLARLGITAAMAEVDAALMATFGAAFGEGSVPLLQPCHGVP
ncbi:lipoyl(octanoyl) transferase LipB [Elioraea sp.]|uniref:lipoyl(octanoyl) transferase LipB n=1 Tax=Elioraea sp. TaxID=2185103 RepID=UPI0021DD0E09|nr:lipoyl(octanoyl) transferase LipB [Elioraea sp.]GIX09454.1 MAG: octanoyltransferase [Elioraea sp.]